MFLWIRLVVANLRDQHSIGALQKAIHALPIGLGEA
jgi:hypothetical protein